MTDLREFDLRLLDHLGKQRQQLAGYAPGLALPGSVQAHRMPQLPGPQLWTPSRGRGASIVVAAEDAPDYEKENADVVCDGVDDQEQIMWASKRLFEDTDNEAGTVRLTPGWYRCSDVIELSPWTTLLGAGPWASYVSVAGEVNGVHVQDGCKIFDLALYSYDQAGPPYREGLVGITESAIDTQGYGYPQAYGVEIAGCRLSYWSIGAHTVSYGWRIHHTWFDGFRGSSNPLTGGLGGWGVVVTFNDDSSGRACWVTDCRMYACNGVFNNGGDDGVIARNEINGFGENAYGYPRTVGVQVEWNHVLVQDNVVGGLLNCVILAGDAHNVMVEGNVLDHWDNDAISGVTVDDVTECAIIGNRIVGQGAAVMFLNDADANYVLMNQLFGNGWIGTIGAITDTSTGTQLYNLDGSAAFWNMAGS